MIHKSNSESSFDSSASEAEAGQAAKKAGSASRFKVENVESRDPTQRRPSTVYPHVLNPKVLERGQSITATLTLDNNEPHLSLKHYLTREKTPQLEHYRLSVGNVGYDVRPSLDDLLEQETITKTKAVELEEKETEAKHSGETSYKLGWVRGVFIKCILNIWGVMLFLRLTWVIGQAGIIEGLCIVSLANLVTLVTGISMSAVSTNGRIKGGGIYYMLSRSLGPEFGGAIGIMIVTANAIACAMYVIGFCESLLDMLRQYAGFNGIFHATERLNDIRLIGCVTMVVILILAIVGLDWVNRVELGLLGLLLIAQVDFIIGSFLPPTDVKRASGFVGYSYEVAQSNLYSDYQMNPNTGKKYDFFTVFAVYFPAVTGIVAGANFSGDLKDPGHAIPLGTLLAIISTYCSYFFYSLMVGCCSLRRASGIVDEVFFAEGQMNETYLEVFNITQSYDNCTNRDCAKGSQVDQQLMENISAFGPLIYAGCFAATLSSAIASLVGAPRVFQAVARDKLFPGISTFAIGCGKGKDPLYGYVLIFFVAIICILIGELNLIAGLLSNFFVAAYGMLNFAVFHASFTNTPGWRPSFKYYNKWLSLFGTLLCIAVMFLMEYATAIATFLIIWFIYIWIKQRKPDANWGSSTQSRAFVTALHSVQSLNLVPEHVKNYRPKIMVVSGNPAFRPSLVDFGNLVTKKISLMTCLNVIKYGQMNRKNREALRTEGEKWLERNHVKAFYAITSNDTMSEGTRTALELYGLGRLSPNMILLGFMDKWDGDDGDVQDFFDTLLVAFDFKKAVGVLRLNGGLDLSDLLDTNPTTTTIIESRKTKLQQDSHVSIDSGLDAEEPDIDPSGSERSTSEEKRSAPADRVLNKTVWPKNSVINKIMKRDDIFDDDIVERARVFRTKSPVPGTIDIYWLYDDGGLTLLLPFILTQRSLYKKSKLRIFFLSSKIENLDEESRNMAELMAKFRIDCKEIIIISDATKKPSKNTKAEFLAMVKSRVGSKIDNAMLAQHSEKINFNLRIAEIVNENSREAASLVVMTLPMPKKEAMPPFLYLALMDYTSRLMPPFLYLRGNQESVLTFYS